MPHQEAIVKKIQRIVPRKNIYIYTEKERAGKKIKEKEVAILVGLALAAKEMNVSG